MRARAGKCLLGLGKWRCACLWKEMDGLSKNASNIEVAYTTVCARADWSADCISSDRGAGHACSRDFFVSDCCEGGNGQQQRLDTCASIEVVS